MTRSMSDSPYTDRPSKYAPHPNTQKTAGWGANRARSCRSPSAYTRRKPCASGVRLSAMMIAWSQAIGVGLQVDRRVGANLRKAILKRCLRVGAPLCLVVGGTQTFGNLLPV